MHLVATCPALPQGGGFNVHPVSPARCASLMDDIIKQIMVSVAGKNPEQGWGYWVEKRDYPFGGVIVENTPYLFKKYLAEAKALTMEKPENERIITINSWNEWGEGSYLEPDTENGMEYLQALRAVFGHGEK